MSTHVLTTMDAGQVQRHLTLIKAALVHQAYQALMSKGEESHDYEAATVLLHAMHSVRGRAVLAPRSADNSRDEWLCDGLTQAEWTARGVTVLSRHGEGDLDVALSVSFALAYLNEGRLLEPRPLTDAQYAELERNVDAFVTGGPGAAMHWTEMEERLQRM